MVELLLWCGGLGVVVKFVWALFGDVVKDVVEGVEVFLVCGVGDFDDG